MTYYKRKIGAVAALGSTWDDVLSTVKTLSGAVDPYLPEVLCYVDQIRALRKDRTIMQAMLGKEPTVPVPSCAPYPPGLPGVGVEQVVKPLRIAVYVNEHPVIVWAGITAVIALPLIIGYTIGRSGKK